MLRTYVAQVRLHAAHPARGDISPLHLLHMQPHLCSRAAEGAICSAGPMIADCEMVWQEKLALGRLHEAHPQEPGGHTEHA